MGKGITWIIGIVVTVLLCVGCFLLGKSTTNDLSLIVEDGMVKYNNSGKWEEVLPLEELLAKEDKTMLVKGKDVEFSVQDGYIVWNYVGETNINKLISIEELVGKQGATGKNGVDGVDGKDGEDGKSTYIWVKYLDTEPTSAQDSDLKDESGSYIGVYSGESSGAPTDIASYTWSKIKGEKGDTGAQGIQGEKGEKGDTGAQGIQGEKGEKGDTGAQGIQGEKGEKGDTGEQGIQGEKGEKGDTGAQGIQGEKGEKGDTGAQGIQGEKGEKGDTGAQGIQGEKGNKGDTGEQGIQGEKGEKGDTGAQGIQGIKGDNAIIGYAMYSGNSRNGRSELEFSEISKSNNFTVNLNNDKSVFYLNSDSTYMIVIQGLAGFNTLSGDYNCVAKLYAVYQNGTTDNWFDVCEYRKNKMSHTNDFPFSITRIVTGEPSLTLAFTYGSDLTLNGLSYTITIFELAV